MHIMQSRRDFLATLSAAGAVGLLNTRGALAAEDPPEVTTIRLPRAPNICVAPQYISDELLRAEGFTEIHRLPDPPVDAVARGEVDFSLDTAAWVVSQMGGGEPVTALSGVHVACYELFAHEPVRTISDLKGKRVGVRRLGSSSHLLLAIMVAQVGLDPHEDIKWITKTDGKFTELFANGRLMPFSGSRRSRRNCAPARSVG